MQKKKRGTSFHIVFLQEIYRIKLPGVPIIGEGKPENQNHAIIFTRGEALQTIDMNQVGFSFWDNEFESPVGLWHLMVLIFEL